MYCGRSDESGCSKKPSDIVVVGQFVSVFLRKGTGDGRDLSFESVGLKTFIKSFLEVRK